VPLRDLAHAKRAGEFAKRNKVVIGVSIDSQFTHLAWRNTPVENGGLGPIEIPLVADVGGEVMPPTASSIPPTWRCAAPS